jgi:pimeloyl-ACP methyl ester carboxylesterase
MAPFVWRIPDKDIRKRLHRIVAPTLALGDADVANPVLYGKEWQRRVKGAEVKLLSGGHVLIHESPTVGADAVAGFLG